MDTDDKCVVWFFVAWLLLGIGFGILTRGAFGQEHQHGVDGLPDWHDPQCCDQQDCRPVPDNEIEFGFKQNGQPAVFHKPTGAVFSKEHWKVSQDERFHVCTRVINAGTENEYIAQYCVYLRAGA